MSCDRAAGAVGHRHRAERRGVAGAPGEEPAVQHQPAADEGADVEVDEVPEPAVAAEGELGAAGGGGVVLQVDRPGHRRGELGAQVGLAPGLELGRRRADLLGPGPELERHRDAEAGDAAGVRAEQRLAGGDLGPDPADRVARRREGVARGGAVADAADEVDEHDLEAAAADLGAEEEGALRIERQRHQRLADPAALRLAAADQPVGFEMAHDHRDGLRREAGHPRDLGLRERPVTADQAQDQALVLLPHAGLVRAAPQRARGPRREGCRGRGSFPGPPGSVRAGE